LHRFFVDSSCIKGDFVTLLDKDSNHIKNVLRLSKGEEIIVCDGNSTDYICEIYSMEKEVLLKINTSYPTETEPPLKITLFQGLPKSDKLEYIIQKCVELGVSEIVPVQTKRSVVKIKDSSKKQERWQKISDEACKQCIRGIIPKVHSPVLFKDMFKYIKEDSLSICAYENEKSNSLKSLLKSNTSKNINIFIGPEGGIDEEEISILKENKFNIITLGPRILRTETAPLALVSALMYESGDW